MKTIVAGCRDYTNLQHVVDILNKHISTKDIILSGYCLLGVDKIAEAWAEMNNIKIELFPANWDRYGLPAGPIRNKEMATKGERLIAIWDGQSKGTKNMIDEALKRRLETHVYFITITGRRKEGKR